MTMDFVDAVLPKQPAEAVIWRYERKRNRWHAKRGRFTLYAVRRWYGWSCELHDYSMGRLWNTVHCDGAMDTPEEAKAYTERLAEFYLQGDELVKAELERGKRLVGEED